MVRRCLLPLVMVLSAPLAQAVQVGDLAPLLHAPQADGRALSLGELRGKVVYVDFWASWCAPCREAMPAYDQLFRRQASRGLVIVGVNLDRERDDALKALRRQPVSFPVVFDPDGIWATRFALPVMPSAYLIDRDGRVRYIHQGFRSGDRLALETQIDQALGARK